MGRHKLFLTVVIAAVVLSALAIGAGERLRRRLAQAQRQALFVQTDNLTANSIMVYDRSRHGTAHTGRHLRHRRHGRPRRPAR